MTALIKATDAVEHLPEMEIMMVGPAQATAWLEATKFDNRRLEDRNVAKITRDIKKNKWVYDGNAIKFDGNGNVIDGQHRLWAIINSNKVVRTLVIRGLTNEAKNVIDTGKTRSNSDILHFNGHVNNAALAGACRISIGYTKHEGNLSGWASGRQDYISVAELLNEANQNKELVISVQTMVNMPFSKKFIGVGASSFAHYILSRQDKYMADNFFYLLEKGSSLEDGDPILVLRNTLAIRDLQKDARNRGGNYRTATVIAVIIKAWNAHKKNKKVTRFRYDAEREAFPVPE